MPVGPRPPARPGRLRAIHARPPATAPAFPIVGVGASAGGLDAFRQLLAHVPPDAGLALVLVQHLEATRASSLSDALAQATTMRVAQAEQGVAVEPNHVYVIPPGVQMALEAGAFKLSPLQESEHRPHLPIDFFLRSLAAERGRGAIGVILSGNASDGTAGLAAIRAQGGITLAQDPRSARFGGMPQSAIDAGVVDSCLPLPALGAELARLAHDPYVAVHAPAPPIPAGDAGLAQVVAHLWRATGVDFGEYKPATFKRRLARRMAVRKVRDVASYLELLGSEPAEGLALYDDLLIRVTSFFRDAESFDELGRVALPALLRQKPPGAPIRAWVVGCATGEEVYSLAILLMEHLDGEAAAHPILVFGSDVSEKAIEAARAGLYPDAAARGLGEARLKRFFTRTDRGWRVGPAVRQLCVFVRHDVARDPPFSRLDVVSCRNVLIYFGPALQRRVLATAHYGLNQPGYLLLGRSESASSVPRWFRPVSPGSRLFLRRPGPSTLRLVPRAGAASTPPRRPATGGPPARADGALARSVDDLVLARYGPPGVVVNDHLDVLQFRGRTGRYLEPPDGEPRNQLLDLARAGLAAPLRLAIDQARKTATEVRRTGVAVEDASARLTCDLTVLPIRAVETGEQAFVVLFEDHPPAPRGAGRASGRAAPARRVLEEERASAREQVSALLEEHSRAHDALASANDELVSGNEELQSLNEELETAKEELQSTNEELATTNDELHARNQDLQVVNADLVNLLDTVEIPILMLDAEHRIRRFTRRAAQVMGITPADVGRRITDLALPVQAPDLERWIARAMEEATLVEAEVQDHGGRWHRLQIRPRRAPGDRVDGAILSLVDIQDLKREVVDAEWARDYARGIVEAVRVPLVVLGADLRVLSANAAYRDRFGAGPAGIDGCGFFELDAGAWDTPELRRALARTLADGGGFQGLEVERDLPGAGRRTASVSASAVRSPGRPPGLLLAVEDVTERRQGELRRDQVLASAQEAAHQTARTDAAKDLFLARLAQELRSPLAAILLHSQALQKGRLDPGAVARAGTHIEAAARCQARLVNDLLEASRAAVGTLSLVVDEVDWRALVLEAVGALGPEAEAKAVQLTAECEEAPPPSLGDRERLQQVLANLVGNAIEFTPAGGHVKVRLGAPEGGVRLVVSDTGQGIDAAFLPHVFERFAQEETDPPAANAGLGLGLALVRELVQLHGGTVVAESPGRGRGSTFTVLIPHRQQGGGSTGSPEPAP